MSHTNYYLARSGETFGPFTLQEIERLRESGEYQKFSWFWDSSRSRPDWQPIDPPPAPPRPAATERPIALAGDSARVAEPARRAPSAAGESRSAFPCEGISALCFNAGQLQAGTLAQATESGCEFVSASTQGSPAFQARARVRLQLADASGRSMTLSARVAKTTRKGGRWHYQLFWKRCPEIIKTIQAPEAHETISNPAP